MCMSQRENSHVETTVGGSRSISRCAKRRNSPNFGFGKGGFNLQKKYFSFSLEILIRDFDINLKELGVKSTVNDLVDTDAVGSIRMGTTVATNALLERAGDPVALVVNKGFKDLLYIGNQARPKIFDLDIRKPSNLYKHVLEADCRIVPAQENECLLGNLAGENLFSHFC